MNKILFASALAVATFAGAPALAQPSPTAPAAPAAMNTASTSIGTLMDNPAAKAVLTKHVPELIANEQFAQARDFTLKQIQEFAPEAVSNETLAKIDADLAKIPAK